MSIEGQLHGCSLGRLLALALAALLPLSIAAAQEPQTPPHQAAAAQVQMTTVPDIVGQHEVLAGLLGLRQAGLQGRREGSDPSPKPRFTILTAYPAPGTRVIKGSTVSYRIASGQNRVPDLQGMTQSQAERELRVAGFERGTVQTQPGSGVAGQVNDQNPRARTLARVGSPVALVLTGTPPVVTVLVPDVIGQPEASAQQALGSVGLRAEQMGVETATGPIRVLRTRPAAGQSVARYSTVGYWISQAPEDPLVPNVVGRMEADSRILLRKAGFQARVAGRRNDPATPGSVIMQRPAGGSRAPADSTIALTIATRAVEPPPPPPPPPPVVPDPPVDTAKPDPSGSDDPVSPNTPDIVVPDITNLPEADARRQLQEAKLQPLRGAQQPSPMSAGIVLASAPAAGVAVKAGTLVSYDVSTGANEVPDLRGQATEVARATLQGTGFQLGTIDTRPDPAANAGTVTGQVPVAGSMVTVGAAVAVTIAQSSRVRVPELRGKPLDQALQDLAQADLVGGVIESKFDLSARNEVLAQSPAPRSELERGAAVNLRVSKGWWPLALAGAVVLLLGGFIIYKLGGGNSGKGSGAAKPQPVSLNPVAGKAQASSPDDAFKNRGPDVHLRVHCGHASVDPPDRLDIRMEDPT